MDIKNLTEEEMQEIRLVMNRQYHAKWRKEHPDKCKEYWTASNAKRYSAKREQSRRTDAA